MEKVFSKALFLASALNVIVKILAVKVSHPCPEHILVPYFILRSVFLVLLLSFPKLLFTHIHLTAPNIQFLKVLINHILLLLNLSLASSS